MAGSAVENGPSFASVQEFFAWLRNVHSSKSSWKVLSSASCHSDGGRFSKSLSKVSSERFGARQNLNPIFKTRVKPNVTFSERQKLKKKRAFASEGFGSHSQADDAKLSTAFSERQRLRRKGGIVEFNGSEQGDLLNSVDHLFAGSLTEYDYCNSTKLVINDSDNFPDSRNTEELESGLCVGTIVGDSYSRFGQCSENDDHDVLEESVSGSSEVKPRWKGIRLDNNARRLVSGAIAGAFSRTAVAPLETIRTHMMVGRHGNSFGQILHWILENEGWTGLFRGNVINVIRVAPSKAIELFVYDTVKARLTAKEGESIRRPLPVASIAGSLAGISSTLCMYPLELLKTRLTIQPKEYRGIMNAFLRIVEEEGVGELYRGLWPSLIGVIPYAGTNYFAYDYLRTLYKRLFKTDYVGNFQTLLIGSAAGAIASTATFPLEVARKQMQVGALQGRVVYQNSLEAIVCIFHEQGMAGLYRGLGPSCLKLMPAAGLSFMCYEALKRVLLEEEPNAK